MSAKKKLSAPLLYYGRIIGLIPFRLDEDLSDLEFSIIGVVYGTVLVLGYSTLFVVAMYSRFRTSIPMETPVITISNGIGLVTEFSVPTVVWLIFAYRQEHISKMLRDFSKIQEIAWEYFEIPIDYETISHHITVCGTWINIICLIRYISANIIFNQYGKYNIPVWVLFSLPYGMQHNVIFVFLLAMNAIGRKFRHLNEKLIQHGRSNNSSRSINDFAYVHGLLCDLAESVNDFFSYLLLLIIIHHLVHNITKIYTICMFLKRQEYTNTMLALICLYLYDIILFILDDYFTGSIVEATAKEARNTGNALHQMANQQRPLKERKQVYAFSIQLLRWRLELTANGFFKFDLSLMPKMVSTGTTYVIIMMQLDNFNPNVPSAH